MVMAAQLRTLSTVHPPADSARLCIPAPAASYQDFGLTQTQHSRNRECSSPKLCMITKTVKVPKPLPVAPKLFQIKPHAEQVIYHMQVETQSF